MGLELCEYESLTTHFYLFFEPFKPLRIAYFAYLWAMGLCLQASEAIKNGKTPFRCSLKILA